MKNQQSSQKLIETKAEWYEYVLIFVVNGEKKYWNSKGSSEETFFTEELRLAERYNNKKDAVDVALTMSDRLSKYFGSGKITGEVEKIKVTNEIAQFSQFIF